MEIHTLEQVLEINKQQQDLIEKLKLEVEKLKAELHKYRNPNTPSGAIPPYLKDGLRKITSEPSKEPESKQAAPNQRNRCQKPDRIETNELSECPYCRSKRLILHLQLPEVENVLHETIGYICESCGKKPRGLL